MDAPTMTSGEFRRALADLGLTQAEAARRLGIRGGQGRISQWCSGALDVPPYIAAHVRTLLQYARHLAVCNGSAVPGAVEIA